MILHLSAINSQIKNLFVESDVYFLSLIRSIKGWAHTITHLVKFQNRRLIIIIFTTDFVTVTAVSGNGGTGMNWFGKDWGEDMRNAKLNSPPVP